MSTLALGVTSQVLCTLVGRVLVQIGAAGSIGLPAAQAHVLDTGPW